MSLFEKVNIRTCPSGVQTGLGTGNNTTRPVGLFLNCNRTVYLSVNKREFKSRMFNLLSEVLVDISSFVLTRKYFKFTKNEWMDCI